MPKKKSSTHHIIPKKYLGQFWISKKDTRNLIRLENRVHSAFHQLFRARKPKEQLEYWYSINRKVLSENTKKKLTEILEMTDEEFYLFHRKK